MNEEVNFPQLRTVRQAAHALNVSESTVRRMLAEGQLEGTKIRKCVRIFPQAIAKAARERQYAEIRCQAKSRRISRFFRKR